MKILESHAKSFCKLKNIKILKQNITGLREVKNTEKNIATFRKRRNRRNEKWRRSVSGIRSDSIYSLILNGKALSSVSRLILVFKEKIQSFIHVCINENAYQVCKCWNVNPG